MFGTIQPFVQDFWTLFIRASQRFANREPTGRVFSQFRCAEVLFHRSFIGTDASVFHVTPPQKIMKCDADIHECFSELFRRLPA